MLPARKTRMIFVLATLFCVLYSHGCRRQEGDRGGDKKAKVEKQCQEKQHQEKAHIISKKQTSPKPDQKSQTEMIALRNGLIIAHSLDGLTKEEKIMVRDLAKAAKIVDELYRFQTGPLNPMWPDGLSDEEFRGFSTSINAREILCPYTVVVRNENNKEFDAIPFSKSELLGSGMNRLSEYLSDAAKYAADRSLKKFLESRSAALKLEDTNPFDDSESDWTALNSSWEVIVGPYESNADPRGRKAVFQILFGKINNALTKQIERIKREFRTIETGLVELVGEDIYKSRASSPRTAIRILDVWMATGDNPASGKLVSSYRLPKPSNALDDGFDKILFFANHFAVQSQSTQKKALMILDASLQKYVVADALLADTALQMLIGGFGASHDLAVEKEEGKLISIKKALSKYYSILDELKNNLLSMWLAKYQRQREWISEDQERNQYVSALMRVLSLLQGSMADSETQAAATLLGLLMEEGGVVWNSDNGTLGIDFDKLLPAIDMFTKKVCTIQFKGDVEQAKDLMGKYIDRVEDKNAAVFKDSFLKIRDAVSERFNAVKTEAPKALFYEIKGLESVQELKDLLMPPFKATGV